jgi:hypothetical protein
MKRLLFGAGALLLASTTVPAAAQEWGGYSGYGRSYGYGYGGSYSEVVRQHVRACRQHARFHERLAEEHDQLHDEGFDNSWDHRDAHDELGDAHDAYHDGHGGSDNCSYWNRQYYDLLQGSRYRGWNDGWYGRTSRYGGY